MGLSKQREHKTDLKKIKHNIKMEHKHNKQYNNNKREHKQNKRDEIFIWTPKNIDHVGARHFDFFLQALVTTTE